MNRLLEGQAEIEAKAEPSKLELEGLIQRFEINVELAWKCLQDYHKLLGYTNLPGPKANLRQALQDELISNNELWLEILEARNKTSHTYD